MVNVERLRAALDYIVEHPEEWRQADWVQRVGDCGTACCLAGTVAIKIMHATPSFSTNATATSILVLDDVVSAIMPDVDVRNEYAAVSQFAREALRLSVDQSDELFDATNTLHDLYAYANSFTNGEIEIPEWVKTIGLDNFGKDYE